MGADTPVKKWVVALCLPLFCVTFFFIRYVSDYAPADTEEWGPEFTRNVILGAIGLAVSAVALKWVESDKRRIPVQCSDRFTREEKTVWYTRPL